VPAHPRSRLLRSAPLQLDCAAAATLEGAPLTLRSREFDLLVYLAAHPGEACPRAELLDQVWGYDFEGDERTVDAHVRRCAMRWTGGRVCCATV